MADVEAVADEAGTPWLALAYVESGPELRRFILGVLGDPSLADDVMQATYLKVVERGGEARPETAKGWLFRVAYHEALTLRRRDAAGEKARRNLARGLDFGSPEPDEGLIRAETVEAVRKALAGLPEDQRRVVQARIYEGRTFAEIARGAGLPLGTVLTRMRRALEKLKRNIDPGA